MTWKVVNIADTGTASKFGADDTDKINKGFSGIDVDDYDINSDWFFRSGKLNVKNPANTFSYNIVAAALAANRTLNLPLLTGTDTFAVLGLAQTFTGAQTIGAKLDVNKNIHYTGVISPTQLSSDQNNYAPTNWATSNVIRLDGDSSFRTITGIGDGSTQTNGQTIRLRNIGSNTILLANQNTSSTAANRFDFDGYDVPVFPKREVEIIYDGTLSRWVLSSPPSIIIPSSKYGLYALRDYLRTTSDNFFNTQTPSGGTVANISAVAAHQGIVEWTSGTSATGSGGDISSTSAILLGNNWYWRIDFIFKLAKLSDVTDTYTLRLGFIDSSSAESTDGVFFRYDKDVNSGKWVLVSRSNSTETSTNASNTAVASATWYHLTIIINPAGTSAEFFQDGTSLGTVASNIPTGAGRVTGAGWMFLKTAGTVDTALVDMDSIQLISYTNTSR